MKLYNFPQRMGGGGGGGGDVALNLLTVVSSSTNPSFCRAGYRYN